MPDIIGAAAQGAGAIISGIAGIGQRAKGRRMLRQIGDEKVPDELIENQSIARNQAAVGLPSEQYAQAMKNIQRQQMMALSGAQDRRGGLGSISAIQQGTNDATLGLDVANAEARLANQRNFMNVNSQVGNFKNKIWERKFNYAMGLLGAGNQNLYSGLDRGAAAVGTYAAGGGFDGKGNDYEYKTTRYNPRLEGPI